MAIDIPRPNINAPTEAGRLEQVRSYLYQISEQLNWALNTIETDTSNRILEVSKQNSGSSQSPEEVQSNFNSIKALIIKSADIVEEYYDKISTKLTGIYDAKYVDKDGFAKFKEQTEADLVATSKDITAKFSNIQQITSDLENFKNWYIDTDAYIKAGILNYDTETGAAVYGLQIGQINTVNGEEIFDKFASFTSDRLSFYDSNDTEVAYISDYKLYITNAEIKGTLTHGGYDIDSTDGLAYMWKGR